MMRTFDATVFNRIAAHPEIVAQFGQEQDFTEMAADPEFFALFNNAEGDGGMVFEWSAPGVWQMHSLFLPSCRGKRAIRDAIDIGREMFTTVGATMIWGQTPVHLTGARMFNRLVGGSHLGFGKHWVSGDVEYFGSYRDDWLKRHGETPAR